MQLDIEDIEKKLQYTFQDKRYLQIAFTHASYAYQQGIESNERLEFLGDSILGFIVSCKLFSMGQDEGDMTEQRKNIVSAKPLEDAILNLKVVQYLQSADNVHLGEKRISSLYEAIVAAIYLDGGIEVAEEFVNKTLSFYGQVDQNFKGQLQEFLQGKGYEKAEYILVEKVGCDHAPEFIVEAQAEGFSARGQGKKIRDAEQIAAKKLLQELQKKLK